jgi:hypothetical protein
MKMYKVATTLLIKSIVLVEKMWTKLPSSYTVTTIYIRDKVDNSKHKNYFYIDKIHKKGECFVRLCAMHAPLSALCLYVGWYTLYVYYLCLFEMG